MPAAVGEPAPVRLVGGFDALLLGYADRSLLVAPRDARHVNAGGGLIKPAVLADGIVVGTWKYRSDRAGDRVEITPFRPVNREVLAGLERETRDIGSFLGTEPVLVVAESTSGGSAGR